MAEARVVENFVIGEDGFFEKNPDGSFKIGMVTIPGGPYFKIEMRGSAPDGTPVSSVGTAIFTVAGSKLSSVRSYIIRQNVDL